MFDTSFRKLLMLGFGLAIIGMLLPNAFAQRFDRGTTITIDHPFELPGITLPAGTYVIRLMDVAGSRNVVQILNADETKSHAIVLALADYRLKTTDDTALSFYEFLPGAPAPVHAWFYPGYAHGVEFVYSKSRAVEIARVSGEEVIATPEPAEEPAAELTTEPLIAVEPGGEEVEIATAEPTAPPVVEAPPAPEPVLTAEVELPRTATPFPLVGLTGLLAAGVAGALRIARKRIN